VLWRATSGVGAATLGVELPGVPAEPDAATPGPPGWGWERFGDETEPAAAAGKPPNDLEWA